MTRRKWVALAVLVLMLAVITATASQLPMLGASGLLHPFRRRVSIPTPPTCADAIFSGVDVQLQGWRCHAVGARRGTLIYLHGVADNRASAVGVIERFGNHGWDVVAYDSRAHGDSGGDFCTYGFLEKQDLARVLDTIDGGPVVLLGTSLGAAVALQFAAEDARARAVIAAETFSDLRSVAGERAPFFFTEATLASAFRLAEEEGRFQVDTVSPASAAAKITIPVFLIHGELDTDTSPEHSRRVFARLAGPKELVIVRGAAHNASLQEDVWQQIERWLDGVTSGLLNGSTRD